MGRMFAVVVFVILLGLVAGFACAGGGVLAYVFGSRGCPHCWPMYKWLTGVYGGGRVFFCELGFEECRRVLDGFIALGVPPYIPVTVLVNGTVRAILVGEYTDRVFVGKLLSLLISREYRYTLVES